MESNKSEQISIDIPNYSGIFTYGNMVSLFKI